MALLEKERRERPQIVMIRHGLLIFDIYEVDQISSLRFNKELRRLDLPDARWTEFRGASGADYLHPLRMDEQAELLRRSASRPKPVGQRGPASRAHKLSWLQAAELRRGAAHVRCGSAGRGRAAARAVALGRPVRLGRHSCHSHHTRPENALHFGGPTGCRRL